MYKVCSELKYYIKRAFKKPELVLSFLFKKHLGLILLLPIRRINDELSKSVLDCYVSKSTNINEISSFYKSLNRDSVNSERVGEWFNKGYDCFLIYSSNKPIGGMWVFKDKIKIKHTSEKTLSKHHYIQLNEDSLYGGYVIINSDFRGMGVYQQLLNFVINYYASNSNFKKLLMITGASNGAIIRTAMKNNAKLIGITKVVNICSYRMRKELFLDKKEKVWNN